TSLRRRPWQVSHGCVSRPYHSFHHTSSPDCSASKPGISTPVPKQPAHQPWRELNENSRGSSSAKLRPQDGQARLVENTVTCLACGASTCTSPLPKSSARSSAARSARSPLTLTSTSATGSSMVCSLKRDRRGQGAVGSSSPSTRSARKPFLAAHLARSV